MNAVWAREEGTCLPGEKAVDWLLLTNSTVTTMAVRIERLKLLARTTSEQPANIELSTHEIQALVLLKRQEKKRHEIISADNLSIGQATLWIAELGGYTGKSSGGPPGSITIQRGLDRLLPASEALAELDREPQ